MTIPEPTPDDMVRDADHDYLCQFNTKLWIRRAVKAERDNAALRAELVDIGSRLMEAGAELSRENERLQADNAALRDAHERSQLDVRDMLAEIERLQALNVQLADRVAAQSELLTKKAERCPLCATMAKALLEMPFDCPYCGTASATIGEAFHADDCPIGVALAKHKDATP